MAAKAENIKVAISTDFLTSYASIPKGIRSKVLEFVNKFTSNPLLPGINYEKIHKAKDKNLRSVRIDQAYRGIVLTPEKENVYMLLWVDSHDRAYRWAENKLHTINPATGSIQVVDTEHVRVPAAQQSPESGQKAEEPAGLFKDLTDDQLMSLGVPELLLDYVKNMISDEELEKAEGSLPQEAFEALYLFTCGYTLADICKELEKNAVPGKSVDTDDFEAALQHEDSKRRFIVIDDELELAAILNAPLEKWRIFLHPSQRKLVERHWSGPVRVLGGAGTGKTVVAMHRARWLAENVVKDMKDKILFTTFTKNLAADIRENLSKLCTADTMRRIEVVNLDRWVSDFLSRQGYSYQIDYGLKTKELWEKALACAPSDPSLPPTFYREEWENVIQPLGITSPDEYMKASRIGRGVKLTRKDKKAVWAVFEDYRLSLDEHRLREADDAVRDARNILESSDTRLPYRAIVVDEGQDMGAQAFRLIRAMLPDGREDDLLIVGDGHQRIYRHKTALSACGINVRGRSRKLRVNYRTTEENRRWAVRLLEGLPIDDLDGGTDTQKDYRALLHGEPPVVKKFATFSQEIEFIAEYLYSLAESGGNPREVCLAARTNGLIDSYSAAIERKGIKTYRVRRSTAEDPAAEGLRCATMHRVKGLEFDRVIIAGVNRSIIPYDGADSGTEDPSVARESEMRERALLYVAATRARKEVLITSFGTPSRFLV
ncbi:MAG: UvrD-helicase domain-containing protein [Candidatus Xenobiia bacterium LiM19]